jgi:hypothetical protein
MDSYLWHREAILTQWHLHLAAHIARSFSARAAAGFKRSGERAGRGGAGSGRGRGGKRRRQESIGAEGGVEEGGRGGVRDITPPLPSSGGEMEEEGEAEEEEEEEEEEYIFSWPPAMPVSVCLQVW